MSKPPNFFTEAAAQGYDARNSKLAPISDCLHFLMRLVLSTRSGPSRVLCVGAGTGAEILALAPHFPEWTFVALDPSRAMLDICRRRVEEAGLSGRCEFVHGYVEELDEKSKFDIVLSLLVAHFVGKDKRLDFLRNLAGHMEQGGHLVNAEISFDLESEEFPSMLEAWRQVQALMGGTAESMAQLPHQLREVLTVLPPSQTEELLRKAGISSLLRFFQAFMVSAWVGRKG